MFYIFYSDSSFTLQTESVTSHVTTFAPEEDSISTPKYPQKKEHLSSDFFQFLLSCYSWIFRPNENLPDEINKLLLVTHIHILTTLCFVKYVEYRLCYDVTWFGLPFGQIENVTKLQKIYLYFFIWLIKSLTYLGIVSITTIEFFSI